MKKKESLWELLRRLDEEAAEYNSHLHHANRYFDSAAHHTKKILYKHEQDLHKTISRVRKALKKFKKKNQKKKDN
jgi:hypothetical protein